jgi:TolB-like protein/DNA-binding winged helix-turn-helix (wHTH) protein/Tfp pilus assembly protein PilF
MSSPINRLYEFGEFRLDAQQRLLRRGEELISLTPKAFEMLLVLVESDGRIVTKDQLMKAVWSDSFVEESNLTQTVFMLRKAMGETAEQRYILTIPGRGYRFAAQVKQSARVEPTDVELPSRTATGDSAISAEAERTALRSALRRWPLFVAAMVVLVSILLTAYFRWFRPAAHAQTPVPRVMLAILPFQNLTGDPAQEYISDGLTEEMITELGRLDPEHLGVIGRTSIMLYKQNPKSLDQVGRDLGVQYVMEGSLRRDADHVRITAQLIQVKDQTHVWAREYDRELKNLLSLQAEIAQEIADEVSELTLGGQQKPNVARRRTASSSTRSYEAYDLYLKGRYFWNKRTPEGFQQAAEYFQQAIAKDPNYARAYAGLADTFGLMSTWNQVPQNEFMPKARIAALKALEIDETLAEAHTSLALVAENYDYDWQTAEKEFRRAIQLDSGYATAHQWYAEYLSWQGRFDEALAESERARRLDPMSLIIATDHGAILYFARQYDRAITQFRAVLDMDPSFPRAHALLLDAYMQEQRFSEAEAEMQRSHTPADSPWWWAAKAHLYSRWGRTAESEEAVAKFEHLASKLGHYRTQAMLYVYLGTGRKDQAINLLQKAYSEHSNVLASLKVDPLYDPLRDDPRFQNLLRRVGLAQ